MGASKFTSCSFAAQEYGGEIRPELIEARWGDPIDSPLRSIAIIMSRLQKCVKTLASLTRCAASQLTESPIRTALLTKCLHVGRMSYASQTSSIKESQTVLTRLLGNRLGHAAGLQASSFWGKHATKAYALIAVTATYLLWKGTFRLASFFVNVTESMAEWGLLGLAATIVAVIGLYMRSYYTINPLSVYRQAMTALHTNPAVLEVLGAPLAGSEVRVMVMSGGGFGLSKALKPKIRSPRVQMLFRIAGSERHGLVSLEVKKKKGKHVFKLLTVDVQPAAFGSKTLNISEPGGVVDKDLQPASALGSGAARVYVYGDRDLYNRGGLLWEMRQPYLNALSLQSSFELEDEVDDELDKVKVPKSDPEPEPKDEKQAEHRVSAGDPAPPVTTEKKALPRTWGTFFFGGSSSGSSNSK